MAEIKDSGERREFESGAVRDIQEGKGRCDLLPLGIVASLMPTSEPSEVLGAINDFMETGKDTHLFRAIKKFGGLRGWMLGECIMEVSKHYEEGAKKYGERNWEKGIPLHCYIDSGVRHFLKYIDNWQDEPHDRAFVWNMLGALWTIQNKKELCDIPHELIGAKYHNRMSLEQFLEHQEIVVKKKVPVESSRNAYVEVASGPDDLDSTSATKDKLTDWYIDGYGE